MQKVHSLWVYFTLEGVIENGSIFKSWTHTSGHFYIGVTTPSPPPPRPDRRDKRTYLLNNVFWEAVEDRTFGVQQILAGSARGAPDLQVFPDLVLAEPDKAVGQQVVHIHTL